MKKVIVILMLLHLHNLYGQDRNCIEMSRQEMLEDLSFLQSHMHTYSAILPLQEQRTGIDMDKEFESLKEQTKQIRTNREFLAVVRKAFILLNDGHSIIADRQMMGIGAFVESDKLDPADGELADYYYRLSTDSVYQNIKCGIRTKYVDGKYYNVRPFTFKNRYVKPGAEITEVNDIPVNDFIRQNFRELYFVCWDDALRQWYDEYFTFAFPLRKFTLQIDGNKIEVDNCQSVDNLQREFMTADIPKMMVINNTILYIRIPAMDRSEWYIRKLPEYYSPSIEKVVLDIRGNGGGSDKVWWDILSRLIKEKLTYRAYIGFNKNAEVLRSSLKIKDYAEDRDGNIDDSISILPSPQSVQFSGKYYVLRDKGTYSAASSLAAVAWQKEDMLLIGEPFGPVTGAGFPAYIFTLPNSRILFTFSYTLDLSGGKENPYMNRVELPVAETVEEYIDRVLHYDSYGVEYLLTKDKMIQAVIND